MEAWIEGQKATATVIKPVTINLNMQHVVKRPRRVQRFDDMVYYTKRKIWPPQCEKADNFWKSTKTVGCLNVRDLVPLDQCWKCFYEGIPQI